MDRLTMRNGECRLAIPKAAYEKYHGKRHLDCVFVCSNQEDCIECPIGACFDKLAEYEDAEEQGLLLHLPCKIGDDIYSIDGFCDYDGNEKCPNPEIPCKDCHYWEDRIRTDQFRLEDLYGDTGELIDRLFLTLEEAEAELKKLEKDK